MHGSTLGRCARGVKGIAVGKANGFSSIYCTTCTCMSIQESKTKCLLISIENPSFDTSHYSFFRSNSLYSTLKGSVE